MTRPILIALVLVGCKQSVESAKSDPTDPTITFEQPLPDVDTDFPAIPETDTDTDADADSDTDTDTDADTDTDTAGDTDADTSDTGVPVPATGDTGLVTPPTGDTGAAPATGDTGAVTGTGDTGVAATALVNTTQAVILNGTSDGADAPLISAYQFLGDFTIEAWIKTSQTTGNQVIAAVSDADAGAVDVNFRIRNGLPNLYITVVGVADNECPGVTNVADDQWHHVAAVRSGVGGIIYVDGVEDATCTLPNSPITADLPLSLGYYKRFDDFWFSGSMDDIRLWNVARDPASIAGSRNNELVGDETGLVGYFDLNGDFADGSANANNGTAVGAPTFGPWP